MGIDAGSVAMLFGLGAIALIPTLLRKKADKIDD
jgi:hypothetical protein